MKSEHDHLESLENDNIYIIREAFSIFEKPAVLWSAGKDSTALLWMIRKAFFGIVPFPVIYIEALKKSSDSL